MIEEGPDYYRDNLKVDRHYSTTIWYTIYVLVCDRLSDNLNRTILDLGCGQGFLAACLRDWGFPNYTGIDFCPEALHMARQVAPEFAFLQYDLNESGWEHVDYDTVVTTEFVEHVSGDVEILEKIRPGTRVILSTTNILCKGHVRAFESSAHLGARYGHLFEFGFTVIPFKARYYENLGWQYFYILDGIRA